VSLGLFKFLLVVEALQFLSYTVHPSFDFVSNNSFVDFGRGFFEIWTLQFVLYKGDPTTILIILYSALFVHLAVIPLISECYYYKHGTKKSAFQDYSFQIMNMYAIMSITILPIPLYNIFMAIVFCDPNSPITRNFQCYEGIYYLHFGAAILGLVLLSILSILNCIVYIEINHSSQKPFASPSSRLNIMKLFMKILIVEYFTIFFQSKLAHYFAFV
jgi:hypothetical protein